VVNPSRRSRVRLLAVDIDGTLLNSRGQIPPENREALQEAVDCGIDVCLVTGRSYFFAQPVFDDLPCDLTLIVSNGALVKSRAGDTLFKRLLPAAIAREVLAAAEPFRDALALMFDRPEGQVVYDGMDWEHPNRRGYFEKMRSRIVAQRPLEAALVEDPVQVMFNGTVTEMRTLRESLRARFDSRVAIALTEYTHRDFSLVDVMAPGCTKGTTLAEWAGRRGIDRDHVMAVGDNFNDEEMLAFAGLPVVMGNAVAELKARGWPVTGTHDDAGLASAIRTFALR
jgi:Cof subfamily protein (haloacid dehalogenase superfamily)